MPAYRNESTPEREPYRRQGHPLPDHHTPHCSLGRSQCDAQPNLRPAAGSSSTRSRRIALRRQRRPILEPAGRVNRRFMRCVCKRKSIAGQASAPPAGCILVNVRAAIVHYWRSTAGAGKRCLTGYAACCPKPISSRFSAIRAR